MFVVVLFVGALYVCFLSSYLIVCLFFFCGVWLLFDVCLFVFCLWVVVLLFAVVCLLLFCWSVDFVCVCFGCDC